MASPFIGIDFGTSKSSVAWYNQRSGQAELLHNAEGEQKTPSIVYAGPGETLVGSPALDLLEDEEERRRVILSVKRDLVNEPTLSLPGRRITPAEVAAAILEKLKHDAEELHFHEPVERVVLTVPATFDILQQEALEGAARLAGFTEIHLLEEPVAAAIAYSAAGLKVGNRVLVYDLGGGTFDLALLLRAGDGFELGMEPQGLARCGGDDFDRALYDHLDRLAFEELGRGIGEEGRVDQYTLQLCRERKETLSARDRALFTTRIAINGGSVPFRQTIQRETFEGLIEGRVRSTVQLTKGMVAEAEGVGAPIDTVVLIGGSTRVPLVERMLGGALPVDPQRWDRQDFAVALGAAWYAHHLWGEKKVQLSPLERYRQDLEQAKTAGPINAVRLDSLAARAAELALNPEVAAALERDILGGTLAEQRRELALTSYRALLAELATKGAPGDEALAKLDQRVSELGLSEADASRAESEVLGDTRKVLRFRVTVDRYRGTAASAWSDMRSSMTDSRRALLQEGKQRIKAAAKDLGLSPREAEEIQRDVMGKTVDEALKEMDQPASRSQAPASRSPASRSQAPASRIQAVAHKDLLTTVESGQILLAGSAALSPDGNLLAIVDAQETVTLWELPSGKRRWIASPRLWASSALAIAFTPDGRYVHHGHGADFWVRDVHTGNTAHRLLSTMFSGRVPTSLVFAPSSDPLKLYVSLISQKMLKQKAPSPFEPIDPPAGQSQIRRWTAPWTAARVLALATTATGWAIAINPGGDLLAATGGAGGIEVWNAASNGAPQGPVWASTQRGRRSVAFSPDGRYLASDCEVNPGPTSGVQLSLSETGEMKFAQGGLRHPVRSLAFSTDSGRLASATGEEIAIWDLKTFERERTLTGHTRPVVYVAFDPANRFLLSVDSGGTINLWKTEP